jgi:hypothetical protein
VLGSRRAGELTTVELGRYDETWRVVVRTTLGPPATLTCRALVESPNPRHEVVTLERL